jgi:hypothetical protein
MHKRESLAKLGFYLLCFFYYLYRCVSVLLSDESKTLLDWVTIAFDRRNGRHCCTFMLMVLLH